MTETVPGPLVQVEWLREHLGDAHLRIVHCSIVRSHYDAGHVPGAVFADIHGDLAREGHEPETGDAVRKYLVPDRDHVVALLRRWGVAAGDRIVFLDDEGQNRHAIRGLWLLRLHGWPRDRAHVLDGGLRAWREAGGALTTDVPSVEEPARDPGEGLHEPDPSILATLDDMRRYADEAAGGGPPRVLDVRSDKEFRGDDLQARRGGHIPGAVNLEWTRFLTADDRLRPADEIRMLADEAAGGDASTLRAAHCQGGVRAALAWFALNELAGLPVANYAASWEEWGNREDTPIER